MSTHKMFMSLDSSFSLYMKEVPLLAILTRNVLKLRPEFLSICEYNISEKTGCYRPLKNGHFVKVCTENDGS